VLVTTFVPQARCPNLLGADLTQQSLYALLERESGLVIASGRRTLEAFARLMQQSPGSVGQMLLACDFLHGPTPELVLVGSEDEIQQARRAFWRRFIPNRVFATSGPAVAGAHPAPRLAATFAGKTSTDGQPTLYECENFACQAPVSGLAAIEAVWDRLAAAGK
jgi:uncharacterized protein YyaL (SSP411 family)